MSRYLVNPKIIEQIKKQTVIIESFHFSSENRDINSGIIIAPDAVLTADHCVIGKTIIRKEKKFYFADEVATKLCAAQTVLINLAKPVFPQPPIKISHNLEIGERVFYINLTFGDTINAFHHGYLSAIIDCPDGITYYQVDGPFCPGMSGAGVYNIKGELVGMIMLTRSTEDIMMTAGLIVPVHYFEPLIYLSRKDLVIKPKNSLTESSEKNKTDNTKQ